MRFLPKIFVGIIAILFISPKGNTQNLVPNPSFEDTLSCPSQSSEITFSTGWSNANTGTADYFNSCFTSGGVSVDVPSNWMGVQSSSSGNGYAGIMLFEDSSPINDYREYVQTQLTSPLLTGTRYYVSFMISHADSSCYVTDDIGAYFSTSQINQGDFFVINQIPQIQNDDGNFLNDNLNWVKVQGSFVALGGESFLTIGNFKDDLNTDTNSTCNTSNLDHISAYYYIDDVCVSPDSMTCANLVGTEPFGNSQYGITLYNNNLTINSNFTSPYNVVIIDISGNILYQSFNYEQIFQLDLFFLNTGLYIIKVFNNSTWQTKKVFINH